jgi:hypothetical protein
MALAKQQGLLCFMLRTAVMGNVSAPVSGWLWHCRQRVVCRAPVVGLWTDIFDYALRVYIWGGSHNDIDIRIYSVPSP